jgi:hypothetical protein
VPTRLYFEATNVPAITPTFHASWVDNTQAVRRKLAQAKAAGTETRSGTLSGAAGNNTLVAQLTSDPIDAQTISGTFSCSVRARELAGTDNINQRVRNIRVFSGDGLTLRGTLFAHGISGVTTEYGTALSGIQFASGNGMSSVVCSAGDVIVVEIGPGESGTGTTPNWDFVLGGNGTDHAITNGDTTGTVPWIEFSGTITFQSAAIDLTIDNLSQAQTLETFAFTQTHELIIADLLQAQNLDNLTVESGAIDLIIANLTQAQTLDNLTITQIHELIINALTQAQTLDNVTITQVHNLVIAALTQAQTLDNVTITQVHQLVIAAITQAQTLDNLTVDSAINLVINALTQAQTLDNLAMTQVHQLVVNALTQAQTLDNLALTQLHQLIIANLTQGQILSNVIVESVGALRPTIDVVAVALLRTLTGIPATRVDTTLPKDTIIWADGFVQAVGISEQSGMYVPLHTSVIAVSCWATNIGSGKPPWGKANQMAEGIKVACLDHTNFPITLDLSSFGNYNSARVHSAYFVNEPHRIPSDEGSYARYDGDLEIHWVPL